MPNPGDPDYTPGDSPLPPFSPMSGIPSLGGCGDEKICDCLGEQLASINSSIQWIARILEEKLGNECDNILKCIDKIVDAINKKYGGALRSCDECRQMAADGMGGTLQYAMQCANACCGECEKQCESSTDDGKSCKGCGCEPCTCYNGECVSIDPESCKEKEKKYQGWCDRASGLAYVTKKDEPAPSPTAVPVALADTELVALEEAQKYCDSYKQPGKIGKPDSIPPGTFLSQYCDVLSYSGGDAIRSIADAGKSTHILSGITGTLNSIGNVGIDGISVENIGSIFSNLYRAYVGSPPVILNAVSPIIASVVGCDASTFVPLVNILGTLGIVQKAVGLDLSQFILPYKYAANAACRQGQLDFDKAIAAYLAHSVSEDQLDAYAAVNGICNPALNHYLRAARSKPVPRDLATMRRREIINQTQYQEGMRQLGYLEPNVSEQLFNLTEQRPPLTDILRFMVRDTDDDTIPDWPDSDRLFKQKYQKTLKDWSRDQGIPELVAKYAWRAHWTIPPPIALFEFYHRLRKDPKFGGQDKMLADIKQALIQQDILPRWHDYYLAVSFRPMTRIDLRRAFNIGALNEKELAAGYTQLGYDDDTVAKMVRFTKRLRDQAATGHRAIKLWQKGLIDRAAVVQRMSADGLPDDVINKAIDDSSASFESGPDAVAYVRGDLTRQAFLDRLSTHGVDAGIASNIADLLSTKITDHPSVKRYIVGRITENDARATMQAAGMNSEIVNRIIVEATDAVDNAMQVKCQQGIHRRYMLGELQPDRLIDELVRRGSTNNHAQKLMQAWDCERSAIGRHVPAAKLCHWLMIGLIQPVEFVQRLINIGFKQPTAELMLQDCLISINQRRLAEAKKLAKEQATAARQAAAMLQRETAREERLAIQQARQLKANQQAREKRDKQLLSAADKITDKCQCDIHAALVFAKDAKTRIISQYALSVDETLQTILLAVEEWQGPELVDLTEILNAMAETASTAGLAPASSGNGSSNGDGMTAVG